MSDRSENLTDWRYPPGAVIGLLEGSLLTPATAAAMSRRLAPPEPPEIRSLSDTQIDVLRAVSARLIPQADRKQPIDLANEFHRRLSAGMIGDGWRYADLPPDSDVFPRGLDLLQTVAAARFDGAFEAASPTDQDNLLRDVQFGRIDDWSDFSSARWFEEVLAALVDIYYSHPVALDEIGYAGMADARGWQLVGGGARAPHEPEPID